MNKEVFLKIYEKFNDKTKVSNGDRAEVRRVEGPSDLETAPSFYKLTSGYLQNGNMRQWQRVVFFLIKNLDHNDDGDSLGSALQKTGKNIEKRLFQVVRSETPNDLIQLRRIIVYTEPTLDFGKFAEQLYYWNEKKKKRIIADFYLSKFNNEGE